jgi:hypothetical protein
MQSETRTFDDLVIVTTVHRFTPAERTGLLVGDLIVSFGACSPSAVLEDRELLQTLKRMDWLTVLRGGIMFRLAFSEGLHGLEFEAATPGGLIDVPTGVNWPRYWGGVQSNGEMILIPENLSCYWTFFPPLLYARFRQWQMLTATVLVWCVGYLSGGIVVFIIAYAATVILPLLMGSNLLREASMKQGYLARGSYAVASHNLAAALEIATVNTIKEYRELAKRPRIPNGEA